MIYKHVDEDRQTKIIVLGTIVPFQAHREKVVQSYSSAKEIQETLQGSWMTIRNVRNVLCITSKEIVNPQTGRCLLKLFQIYSKVRVQISYVNGFTGLL